MKSNISINMVSAHAEGEVGNVIIGGVAPPPGETLWEMREFLETDQKLRNLLLNEPRGGVFKHINLIVPAKNPLANFGFLIMEPVHTPPMSGSNAICVATVLLETGMIEIQEPLTTFNLETPAGLIEVKATCFNGEARKIEIKNIESFADKLDVPLKIDDSKTLLVDTAFGGDSFVIVDAASCGLKLDPKFGKKIVDFGRKIIIAANEQIGFNHPSQNWNHISFCQFTNPVKKSGNTLKGLSAVVIEPGKIDRSPCGTGCSARMAVMAAKGKMKKGGKFVGKSIIGGTFECKIEEIYLQNKKQVIIPKISGRGYITGTHQIMRDPSDPWPFGYRVADTWPNRKFFKMSK